MTTLAAGSSVTVAVRDGGTVAIATNGGLASAVVTLTEGGSSTVSLGPLAERRVLGPFKEGASVAISNATCGSLDYDVETTFDPSSVAITGGTIDGVSGLVLPKNVTPNGASRLNYRKAVAKVLAGQRARLLILGDSTTMGAGAGTNSSGTTGVVGARAKNWPTKLAAALTSLGIPTYNEAVFGDQNVTGTSESQNAYDPRVNVGTWATANIGSVGCNAWSTTASGAVFAFTPSMTFDRFDVYTVQNAGHGTITANVDGGATLATINCAGAANVVKTTVSCTRGTHTINLTSTVAAQTYLLGIVPWDSTVGGLDIIQGGHWGGSMSLFASTASAWSVSSATNLSAIAPDIAIVQLTINDAAAARTQAAYSGSLVTVDSALAAAGAEVVLMTGIPSKTSTVPPAQTAVMVGVLSARAQTQGYLFADLGARSDSYSVMNAAGFMFDDLHGNAKFYSDEAYWFAQALVAMTR